MSTRPLRIVLLSIPTVAGYAGPVGSAINGLINGLAREQAWTLTAHAILPRTRHGQVGTVLASGGMSDAFRQTGRCVQTCRSSTKVQGSLSSFATATDAAQNTPPARKRLQVQYDTLVQNFAIYFEGVAAGRIVKRGEASAAQGVFVTAASRAGGRGFVVTMRAGSRDCQTFLATEHGASGFRPVDDPLVVNT